MSRKYTFFNDIKKFISVLSFLMGLLLLLLFWPSTGGIGALVFAKIIGLFLVSVWITLFFTVDEILIEENGISIRRWKNRVSISNELIAKVKIWQYHFFGGIIYVVPNKKGKISLAKRIHLVSYYSKDRDFLPMKEDLLATYGKKQEGQSSEVHKTP